MNAPLPSDRVVEWVADLLHVAWQRQETEGRYRGADDFRGLHIGPDDALASWRAIAVDAPAWPDRLAAGFADVASDVAPGVQLSTAEALVAALAVSVEWEPRLRPLVAALTDEPTVRLPTVGLAGELAAALGLGLPDVRRVLIETGRLAFLDVVRVTPSPGRPSLLDAQLVASRWLIEGEDALPREWVPVESSVAPVPQGVPLLLIGADHRRHAEHAAAAWGVSDVALTRDAGSLGTAVRAALVRGAGVVIAADSPDAALVDDCELAASLGCPIAVSLADGVSWIPPASWPQRTVTRPTPAERAGRWAQALAASGVDADASDVASIAGEYRLGFDAIGQATQRVTHLVTPLLNGGRADLPALRLAARRTAWKDLSSCARPGPTGNTWADLVVTGQVLRQLRDIAAAINTRGRVLDEWGFGGRPGSRGYHVLFAGPSGTGKTMSASVIAAETGLELWVVDLARVVDKYLGETEKALDRVLRAAESSGALLLFDEADALFGRRGEVREAKDRWANVEVAYLLQRIEEHDGVSVLTTNVSHHIDEAFARRMSQRVEFTVPDATLRRQLWLRSIPDQAPLADADDLGLVADRFELAGGAIRTAALNAAYEAAAAGGAIELPHLVRAGVRELTKAGRPPTRTDLAELAVHLDGSR